ncbi:hypothetical protein phiCbK_286 [Caulobacter phage phiCbK]|uniref:Uncharacterized protein n=5 Tax=Viruses TaxID=10239 RepID=J3SL19_9CAUD|nr:hypothetical protein D865_gp033 [Caulobacter phage phiCbK]AFO71802.1 hypothetical protein phiCbK_286 [Caulobacter phage phiCbK]AFU86865.1 hypothetical protein CbK_gp033 [Caulobacter phage phiCbK]ARB14952.1 hypothetical protein Ccr32_gp033 [Caulobacter phage Ccr32]ARB15283.1 hypothetical protein Ccr34_gp034 [Caulobacter phage Ccr34]
MTDSPLHPTDRAILDLLQEEAAETLLEFAPVIARLVKIASKVKRFGNGTNPFDPGAKPNFELLEDEIGDLEALVDLLTERGLISRERIAARKVWKRGMLKTHGTLPEDAFSAENLPPPTVQGLDLDPSNPIVALAAHVRNGGYTALFGGHAPSAEPPDPGKPLYIRYIDSQSIHSNRFLAWEELSRTDRQRWNDAAKAGKIAP